MLSSRDHQLLIGAQAFDDLIKALETLGDVKGMTWVKEQTDLLKSTKRYLKSDYKVMVCSSVLSVVLSWIWDCSCTDFSWSQFLKQKSAAGIVSILWLSAEQPRSQSLSLFQRLLCSFEDDSCRWTYTCAVRWEEQNSVLTILVPRARPAHVLGQWRPHVHRFQANKKRMLKTVVASVKGGYGWPKWR